MLLADTIAVLVSTRSDLAERDHVDAGELARRGIWWPMAGSSRELRAFVEEYARSIGATLIDEGSNLGLDAAVERAAGDPTAIVPVVATWPLAGRPGVRVRPLRPTPRYPWYAVWRTASAHPSLPVVLRALRGSWSTTLSPPTGTAGTCRRA